MASRVPKPPRARGRPVPDRSITIDRRDVDDPAAWDRLVKLLADLLYPPR